MRCTVKWFDAQKGYGILSSKDSKEEYFVYQSTIAMDGFRYLCEDDVVDFNVSTGKDGRNLAVDVTPVLTRKMVEDSLKEENLYVRTMKDAYKVTKYLVVDQNDVIQTSEQGMDFLNLAAYAGFDTEGLSA
jgi:cold shock CspA family protein